MGFISANVPAAANAHHWALLKQEEFNKFPDKPENFDFYTKCLKYGRSERTRQPRIPEISGGFHPLLK